MIDPLEKRCLFSGETVQTAIAPLLATVSDPSSDSITLNQHFFDSTLPGTLATFTTNLGTIQVGLTDAATPLTVANFLSYVNGPSGDNYNDTFFHRSVDLNTNLGGSPSAPATIIQGGGYALMNGSIGHITTSAPVEDEFQTEILKDTTDTLAMAKTSDPNSATSEFYFNVTDNTELDTPTTVNGVETSYTVFGTVLSGADVISEIAALPTDALDSTDGLTDVPITGLTQDQLNAGAQITANNLVFTESVTTEAGTSYTVSSDNSSLVKPVVSNGVLSFTYGSGQSGTADITVTGKNLDGTSASTTFSVTVPNPATPGAGPVANTVTAPTVVTGTSGSFSVLGTDTDSLSPLNPSSVTVVSGPQHGTASVNSADGFVTYTPTAGYLGTDSLTYTVADELGNRSSIATVNLDAVPPAVTVTIGVPGARSLTFVEPDGVTGHVTVNNGSATITFSSYQVTTTHKSNGLIVASGPGATIQGIVVSDAFFPANLSLIASGPITLHSFSVQKTMGSLYAPQTTLTGTATFGGIYSIDVAAIVDATVDTGVVYTTSLIVPNVTNSNITCHTISLIKSKQWLDTDGGTYTLSTQGIESLNVSGTFAENLSLSSTGYSLFSGKIGQATGTWTLSGSIYRLNMTTPGSNFTLSSDGLIRTLAIKGSLANQITAAAIGTLSVSGPTSGAVIQTDANFSSTFNQIQHISFGGAVTNSVIFSAGNIGSISAPSLTGSRIYAGVELAIAQNAALATNASNLSNDAKITSISLGRGVDAFSNSLINADLIGSLSLGKIKSSNNQTPFGVAAHTIGHLSGALVPGGAINAGPTQLKNAAALTAYETKQKLALGDLQITLF